MRYKKAPSIKSQEKEMAQQRMDDYLRPLKDAIKRFQEINKPIPELFKGSVVVWREMQQEIEISERSLGKEKVSELVTQFANEAYANPHVVNHRYIISKLQEARQDCL